MGLTLQHTQSWDFPTPPRTLCYVFHHSPCTGLQAPRQFCTHSQGLSGFAKRCKLWCVGALVRSGGGFGSVQCFFESLFCFL